MRSYKTTPVPTDFIQKILEAARWAPSGANSQPWEFIVITNRDEKDEIGSFIKENLPPSKQLDKKEPNPPE